MVAWAVGRDISLFLHWYPQPVYTVGSFSWFPSTASPASLDGLSLQQVPPVRCCVVNSQPSYCWRISACFLHGHGHHVSLSLCCCFLAFNVFLCCHSSSLQSSLKLRICDSSLALACRDCLCSPGNARVQDCLVNSVWSTLLWGLFYSLLIATFYQESACIVQAPDTPHPGLFLNSVVPQGFLPVTIPFLLWLLSPSSPLLRGTPGALYGPGCDLKVQNSLVPAGVGAWQYQ